jgi:uncharacterized protein (TIGR02421 family)
MEPANRLASLVSTHSRVRFRDSGLGTYYQDRRLPFLVLYKKGDRNHHWEELARTEASYFIAEPGRAAQSQLDEFLNIWTCDTIETFGAALLVQLVPEFKTPTVQEKLDQSFDPYIKIYCDTRDAVTDTFENILRENLRRFSKNIQFDLSRRKFARAYLPQELPSTCGKARTIQIGMNEFFIEESEVFPVLFRNLRAALSRSLRYVFYQFCTRETSLRAPSFHSLGRRNVQKAIFSVDQQLSQISESFDFVLSVNPVNSKELWRDFKRSDFQSLPEMRYRPLPVDVALSKRQLFSILIEKIEEPGFARVFLEKQEELDRQLTLLGDRGTRRFLLGCLQIYGTVSPALMHLAEELLERIPGDTTSSKRSPTLNTSSVVERVNSEMAILGIDLTELGRSIRLVPDLMAGIMVSSGNILIDRNLKVNSARLEALIQHEIGTHLVTWYNGRQSGLGLLETGFAGYEELQEGLAVLAELVVQGITPLRIRILAARVIAAKAAIDGAEFVEVFRTLCRYGFSQKVAFNISIRIFRGGGFIKDLIYLRGFQRVLNLLQAGQSLQDLYLGKISHRNIAFIEEIKARDVVKSALIVPGFLADPMLDTILDSLSNGGKLHQIIRRQF